MADAAKEKLFADMIWNWYLVGDDQDLPDEMKRFLAVEGFLFRLLPGKPRCTQCNAPLGGAGLRIVGPVMGIRPSVLSPRLCNGCEQAILKAEGGAQIALSLLFADIRGSTSKARETPPAEYTKFIQRFYKAASAVLINHNALVNRLAGDQVIGLFVPRFAGADHSRVAVEAAMEILKATGHADPEGPWAPVGVGVHTDTAYVGAVGSKDGVSEITVLGNAANLTARLSSSAAQGELLISAEAARAAKLHDEALEQRSLQLKGIDEPVHVYVMQIGQPA
jgi:adenylate cyclase